VAAAVVLLANAWAWVSVRQNRKDAFGGTIELTENELRLPRPAGDSTVIRLELEWSARKDGRGDERSPDWLSTATLIELGIDCRVPGTDPDARGYYSSRLPVEVCLVLEYRAASSGTRLLVVDAGRDAHRLREQYADPIRYIIARGVMRCYLQRYEDTAEGTIRLERPRPRGRIEILVPDIYVPQPYSKVLQELRSRADRDRDERPGPPRFAVKVAWGVRLEPWVQEVRLLPAASD
jgi:hypothetical protein